MKCTLKQLTEAVDFFRYNHGISNEETLLDIVVREENIDSGEMIGTLLISAETEKPQDVWSRYSGVRKVKYTLEVFSNHENRRPILVMQEVQELSLK